MRVYSIFNSISGEIGGVPQGTLTTFVRLAGCNIRCTYCDTKKAQSPDSGEDMSIDEILSRIADIGCKHILFTGGEPLIQKDDLHTLVLCLKEKGYIISVETNGTTYPHILMDYYIFDYKLPGSGCEGKMMPLWNWKNLPKNSYIKFVCTDRTDYRRAKEIMGILQVDDEFNPVFSLSPAQPLHPSDLIGWMQEDKLFRVPLNIQIHKYIFPSGEKGDY